MMHWLSDFGGGSWLHCILFGARAWVVMRGMQRIVATLDRGSLTRRQVQRGLVIAGILGIIWLTTPRAGEVAIIIGALMVTGWIVQRIRNVLRSASLVPHRPRFFGCESSLSRTACCCESRGRQHWADGPVTVHRVPTER